MSGLWRFFATLCSPVSPTGSLLPKVMHMNLYDYKERLLIIGDVHGCLSELKRLLAKVEYSPETMTVIFVGDLVSKGPDSAKVVEFVRLNGFLSVRGNHEDNILLGNYNKQSKYANRVEQFSAKDLDFIRELPLSITVPALDLLVVHAGVNSHNRGCPVSAQSFNDLIRIRCVCANGTGTPSGPKDPTDKFWASIYTGPPFIVFGHDAKRRLQIHPWARGLDTGCVYGGSLSGLLIEDTRKQHDWMNHAEIISVPAVKAYVLKDDD